MPGLQTAGFPLATPPLAGAVTEVDQPQSGGAAPQQVAVPMECAGVVGPAAGTALTDAATVATDASLGNIFSVTLGGNRTFGAPTNLKAGAVYRWKITQDGTGSRTGAFNAIFKFAGGTPTLSTGAGAIDWVTGYYDGTTIWAVLDKAFA